MTQAKRTAIPGLISEHGCSLLLHPCLAAAQCQYCFILFYWKLPEGRFFCRRGPHAITIAWGEAERSLRVSRAACGAGSYRDFRDDEGGTKEPSLCNAGGRPLGTEKGVVSGNPPPPPTGSVPRARRTTGWLISPIRPENSRAAPRGFLQ